MRKGARVYLAQDPTTIGTVQRFEEGIALVKWRKNLGVHDRRELRLADDRVNSVSVPEIQDLEYSTRLHPDTQAVVMQRDAGYRGDANPGPVIAVPEDLYELFQTMGALDQEHIIVGLMDVRGQLVGWKVAHKGALDNVQASARDMLKDAYLTNARCMFMIHNHPSGDPSPSEADAELTAAVEDLANEGEVCFFDHVIVGRPGLDPETRDERDPYFSFREHDLLGPIEVED